MKKRTESAPRTQAENEAGLALAQLVEPMLAGMATTRHNLLAWVHAHGLAALDEVFREEAVALAGPKGRHHPSRTHHHWGTVATELTFGGRRVQVPRPRVRGTGGGEATLPSIARFRDRDPLSARMMQQLLAGVSARQYEASLEAPPAGWRTRGSSKSAVSRTVVRRTRARLQEQLTRRLEGLEVVALFMDGVVVAGQTVIVILGITRDGTKQPLGVRLGSTENAVLCTELLQDLLARGLALAGRVLCVIDGGKGLRKALADVLGDAAVIQRCQLHKGRNLDALVPKARQAYVRTSLRRAYRAASAVTARRQLLALAAWLDRNGAADVVSRIEYHLGVSHASLGDFGSAGGAEFRFFDALPHPFLTVEGGQFGFARLAGGGSSAVGPGTVLAAAELKGYDGPWLRAEQLRKASGLVKYAWRVGGSQFSVLGMAYHNAWNASDQVPQRAVDGGLINSFGQIDSTLGGETSRYSLSGTWSHIGGASVQTVQLFGIRSSLNLFSNFTYGLVDSTAGDQFNQRESRTIVGGNASHHVQVEAWGVSHTLTFGLQHRSDFVRGLGLYRTLHRQRLSIVRQDDVSESGTGLYLEAVSRWLPWFRSTIGVRGDAYAFDVSGDRPENGGSRSATLASPKVSLAFTPVEGTELYVSGGLGFHSNDARGTTIRRDPVTGARVDRVDPLVRSRGVEVGLRTSPLPGWRATFAAWALDLDSELLFVGDGGTTAPSSRSSRQGVTLANFYRPGRSLAFDLDVSFARARFGGVAPGQGFVPGSLEQVVAAGVTYGGGAGAFVALRLRHFGAYPLAGDNRVRATPATLLNGDLGYQFGAVRVQLSLLNLLDSNARDIQYFYTSRLSGEPAGGVGDVHYHQMEPRQVRVAMRRDW